MSLNKLAAISNNRAKINSIVIEHLQRYAALNEALDQLVSNPNDATASQVDGIFNAIGEDLAAIRNVITTLANVIVSEDGNVEEIDAREEENGMRLL